MLRGACGALGAAMWITGMNNPEEKTGLTADGTKVGEMMDTFLEASGHEFECVEIVGRSFEDEADQAQHVAGNGCAGLLEAMARKARADEAQRGDEIAA